MSRSITLFRIATLLICLRLAAGSDGVGVVAPSLPTVVDENQRPENLAIIVNKSNPVNNLTYAELRKIFLAERSYWPSGRKITVVMRERGQLEHGAVLREIYRMGERDFNRHFLHIKFNGDVQSTPKVLSTAAGLKKFVFNVPGAIGYVRIDQLDDSVKLVRIDDRAPEEPGYKIKLFP